ncbi:hypothetical protein [Carboxylicivirga taeanensis]|uniref:hypothetical protein n=1 Tax=Carboxylicivirga taeanensis TaxID=1416875 RepID=UPI003F6DCE80
MSNNWKRKLFLNRRFEVNSFQVGKVGLESSVSDIDYFDITDIYVDKEGSENLRFKDRLDLLEKGKGWIHCASGVSYKVKEGIIKQIKLATQYLQDNKTDRKDIIEIFGKPDIELVDDLCYSGIDYNVDANVLVFRNKKIYAFLDPKTDKLKELHFGEFDEKAYGNK